MEELPTKAELSGEEATGSVRHEGVEAPQIPQWKRLLPLIPIDKGVSAVEHRSPVSECNHEVHTLPPQYTA